MPTEHRYASLVPFTKQLQQEEEELYDVQVKVNGSHAVVIDAEPVFVLATNDQLCVEDEVARENYSSNASIDHLKRLEGRRSGEAQHGGDPEGEAHPHHDEESAY